LAATKTNFKGVHFSLSDYESTYVCSPFLPCWQLPPTAAAAAAAAATCSSILVNYHCFVVVSFFFRLSFSPETIKSSLKASFQGKLRLLLAWIAQGVRH